MNFIDSMKERASKNLKTIVLPESSDIRVLEAARKVTDQGFAKVILLGNKDELQEIAGEMSIADITVINPLESDKREKYVKSTITTIISKGIKMEM